MSSNFWSDFDYEAYAIKAWQASINSNPNGSPQALAQRAINLANAMEEAMEVELARREREQDAAATNA